MDRRSLGEQTQETAVGEQQPGVSLQAGGPPPGHRLQSTGQGRPGFSRRRNSKGDTVGENHPQILFGEKEARNSFQRTFNTNGPH